MNTKCDVMKTLLILTGPQGAGNHLFSKVFALHPAVSGWSALLDQYWIGHDNEPFADCWADPKLLLTRDFSSHDYWVTSISCPYMDNGIEITPKYRQFVETAKGLGIRVIVAVIGRDQNILKSQQKRVRDNVSLVNFTRGMRYLTSLSPIFISQELLYLYRHDYLVDLSTQLEFPVDSYNKKLKDILKDDANTKYIKSVGRQRLDLVVDRVSKRTSRLRSLLTRVFLRQHETDEEFTIRMLKNTP
jgi:hypothetical protein